MEKKIFTLVLCCLAVFSSFVSGCGPNWSDKAEEIKQHAEVKKDEFNEAIKFLQEARSLHSVFAQKFWNACKAYKKNMEAVLGEDNELGEKELSKEKIDKLRAINREHVQTLKEIRQELMALELTTEKGIELRKDLDGLIEANLKLPEMQLQLMEGDLAKMIDATIDMNIKLEKANNEFKLFILRILDNKFI